jgi:hypothetical protein
MRIGPGTPSQLARAYGLPAPAPVQRLAPTAPMHGAETPGAKPAAPVGRLVGAVVPGKVSFAGDVPTQEGAIAFYRHPADKNAAATGVSAGRMVDLTA